MYIFYVFIQILYIRLHRNWEFLREIFAMKWGVGLWMGEDFIIDSFSEIA